MSAAFAGFGAGGMAGPPLLSWLQEHASADGSYSASFVAAAACLAVTALLHVAMLLARLCELRRNAEGKPLLESTSSKKA